MRKILFFAITVLSIHSFAGSDAANVFEAIFRGIASAGSGKGGKNLHSSVLRIAGGYEMGSIRDDEFDTTKITGFDKPAGTFGEADLGSFAALHFGVAKLFDDKSQFNFNNGGLKDAEVEMTLYQYGLKLILPGKNVNPYIGAGYVTGPLRMKDESTGEIHVETLHGLYWHAGADILFSRFVGIRLGYQVDDFVSEQVDITAQSLAVEKRSGRVGLILHF